MMWAKCGWKIHTDVSPTGDEILTFVAVDGAIDAKDDELWYAEVGKSFGEVVAAVDAILFGAAVYTNHRSTVQVPIAPST